MLGIRISDKNRGQLLEAVRHGEIKKVLLARCQKIGDMLTFLPTILCVRELFPLAQLTLLCRKEGLIVAERIPFLSILLVDDLDQKINDGGLEFDLLITSSQDAAWIRLGKRLKIRFLVGALPETLKGVCLKHRWQFRNFTAVARYSESEHDVDRNLKTLGLLGRTDCRGGQRDLWITPDERKNIASFLPGTDAPFVVVSPSGSKRSKNWNPGYFAEVCDRLAGERGAYVVFIGKGGLAEEQADGIMSRMRHPSVTAVNRTTFGEMCALIESCDVLISVDSGTAHVASCLNRPLVVLFGPGDLEQWRPWHEDRSLGIALNVPCKCGTTTAECREKRHCLDALSPEEVFRAASELLDRRGKALRGAT